VQNLITIQSYDSAHKANMAKACLMGEGIDVFLKDELTNQIRNYPNAYNYVQLQVQEFDAEKALDVLIVYGYAKKIENKQNVFLQKVDNWSQKIPLFGELFFELRIVAIIGFIALSIIIPIVLLY